MKIGTSYVLILEAAANHAGFDENTDIVGFRGLMIEEIDWEAHHLERKLDGKSVFRCSAL